MSLRPASSLPPRCGLASVCWWSREVTTLPSGMRVASQYTPDETVTVGVWIDAGSRFETKVKRTVVL